MMIQDVERSIDSGVKGTSVYEMSPMMKAAKAGTPPPPPAA
jgi:hypothetical protein